MKPNLMSRDWSNDFWQAFDDLPESDIHECFIPGYLPNTGSLRSARPRLPFALTRGGSEDDAPDITAIAACHLPDCD